MFIYRIGMESYAVVLYAIRDPPKTHGTRGSCKTSTGLGGHAKGKMGIGLDEHCTNSYIHPPPLISRTPLFCPFKIPQLHILHDMWG